jgi:hypothetical protein
MKGRKKKVESRAQEIRTRLLVWTQSPESLRPSLRVLACELGTSHQLLAHYLDGLDLWQAKEQAKRIRDRARAEGREMTMRECLDAIVTPGTLSQIKKLRREAKRGPLDHWQVQTLKLWAKQFPGAKEILETCRQMTPQEERQARASERAAAFASAASDTIARIRKEAERGPLSQQDVVRLKFFARRGYPGAKELLKKCSVMKPKTAELTPNATMNAVCVNKVPNDH